MQCNYLWRNTGVSLWYPFQFADAINPHVNVPCASKYRNNNDYNVQTQEKENEKSTLGIRARQIKYPSRLISNRKKVPGNKNRGNEEKV